MSFRTKIDYSSNRQIKQFPANITYLSGGTSFGLPFSALTSGPDLTTSAITETYPLIISTFSGNSATTIFTWYDSRMSLGEPYLSALTPSNSAITQDTGVIFTANTTTIIDGNTVVLTYTGVSFGIDSVTMTNLGGGNYSGSVTTNTLDILSASTLDYTGRTIWVDVSGITRTNELIVTKNPQIGYVLTCINNEGKVEWQSSSGASFNIWTASTGTPSAVLSGSSSSANGNFSVAEGDGNVASGDYGHAEGYQTTASGNYTHAEGYQTTASHSEGCHSEGRLTIASNSGSHAEGNTTTASGGASHAEGNQTIASGNSSHSEGFQTTAGGYASHAEGYQTTASGYASHAGGHSSYVSGLYSFVHGSGSTASGNNTIVLGANITGSSDNTTYVDDLIIVGLTSQDPIATDVNGRIVAGTSDIRLKQNINTLTDCLKTINNLRGVSFEYTDASNMGSGLRYGFIAQEVQKIVPTIVRERPKSAGMLSLNYVEIIPILVEAVKEILNKKLTNVESITTQTILAEDNDIQLNFNGNNTSAIGGGIRVLYAIDKNSSAELITDTDGNWVTNNDFKAKALTIPYYTPASSNDNGGSIGNMTRDENYLYVKTDSGWKRSNLESF